MKVTVCILVVLCVIAVCTAQLGSGKGGYKGGRGLRDRRGQGGNPPHRQGEITGEPPHRHEEPTGEPSHRHEDATGEPPYRNGHLGRSGRWQFN